MAEEQAPVYERHMPNRLRLAARIVALLGALTPLPAAAICPGPVGVQILGSGGPVSDDARASSGYLVWIDGHARLLVDAGGGVFLRFGEAKARFDDLDAIAITHLHADHVVDLIAILKSGFFGDRKRPLPLIGPTGSGAFPGIKEFARLQLDPKRGAYRYLSGYLDGSGGLARLAITEVPAKTETPRRAFANSALTLTAIGVKHGPVPALGFLVEAGGRKIAFAGDQGGGINAAFAAMIKGADVLVMDHAIPEDAGGVETALHDRPSEIGKLAAAAGVGRLVLSHNMARSQVPLQRNLALIGAHYKGPTLVATDLMCLDWTGANPQRR